MEDCTTKPCSKCGVDQPLTEFFPYRGCPRAECKTCFYAARAERRKRHPGLEGRKAPCPRCGHPITQHKKRITPLCRVCYAVENRCPCGQFLNPLCPEAHICPKTLVHHCRRCGAVLDGTEGERTCRPCQSALAGEGKRRRRRALLAQFGGRCMICGYARSSAALQFHHVVPWEKRLWSGRKRHASLTEIERHPERFRLLCANCHAELHSEE